MILCTENSPKFAVLRLRLNTFRVFSEYAERMKKTKEEIFIFKVALGFLKGQYFKKI
jgi:hypothetical protein